MVPILTSGWFSIAALAILLLAILLGYRKGRDAVSLDGQSLAWTHIPLVAFVIASFGPSVFAVILYLGYKIGLIQPPPSGYRFSTFIRDLPVDFAIINWGFVALYVVCRLWPNFGSARLAMWFSVIAMAVPNSLLFSLAWEMVSNVFDAGQGIGVIVATISLPVFANFWSGPAPAIFDAGFGIGPVISALTAPIPFFGLIGWLAGQLIGWVASSSGQDASARS